MAGKFLVAAGIAGFVGVAAGAAGTHALAGDPHAQGLVETASRFLMIHAALLVGVTQLNRAGTGGWLVDVAGWLFTAGLTLFGGGLLVSATVGLGALGFLVPTGGTLLMLGWLVLVLIGARRLGR